MKALAADECNERELQTDVKRRKSCKTRGGRRCIGRHKIPMRLLFSFWGQSRGPQIGCNGFGCKPPSEAEKKFHKVVLAAIRHKIKCAKTAKHHFPTNGTLALNLYQTQTTIENGVIHAFSTNIFFYFFFFAHLAKISVFARLIHRGGIPPHSFTLVAFPTICHPGDKTKVSLRYQVSIIIKNKPPFRYTRPPHLGKSSA